MFKHTPISGLLYCTGIFNHKSVCIACTDTRSWFQQNISARNISCMHSLVIVKIQIQEVKYCNMATLYFTLIIAFLVWLSSPPSPWQPSQQFLSSIASTKIYVTPGHWTTCPLQPHCSCHLHNHNAILSPGC